MPITFTTARRAPTTAHVVAHGVTTEGFEDGSGLPDGVEAGALGQARSECLALHPGSRTAAKGPGSMQGLPAFVVQPSRHSDLSA